MKKITNLRWLIMSLLLAVSAGSSWGATKNEGFETAPTSTTYNSTKTYSTSESDCGIAWRIYYGTVSTSSAITGSKSAAIRYYSGSSDKYGYLRSTTAIDNLSKVTFNGKVGNTGLKVDIKYSTDGNTWTAIASGVSFTTGSKSYSYDVPEGGKYIQIGVSSSSSKPSSGNWQLTIDDVEFTYTDGGNTAAVTTTTIDASDIVNTDLHYGTEAGTLTASVTSGGSAVSGATVTWSSSNTNVATIASDGTVTLVAAGTTTITASYAGVSGTYEASSATYSLTVTNSAPANELVTVDGEGNVTFLFNDTGWGLPMGTSSNAVSTVTTYTNSGYSIILGGGSPGHYYNANGMLIMGKSGAYLTLPAFDFDVERIEVVGKSGASGAVVQNIYVGENAVSTATTGATGTNLYNIAQASQAAGNVYTLKVTSAHNTQITSITVYKKSTTPSLSFASATATVNVDGTYTQTVNSYNIGENTVNYTTGNAEIATVNASTGEVTGVSEGTVTITAHVTVAGVEHTADYELTVQKNDPELSFATPVVSISETETYAGQTVTKPADILDSEITYSSNNPTVATVDASTGAITVAGGIGTTVITATFAGNTKYNAGTATYTLKVTAAGGVSGDYVKITSTDDLTDDGEYLIVWEDADGAAPVAFNGALSPLDVANNNISVTISESTIPSTTEVDAAAFTITAVEGGYAIESASQYYIGQTSDANGLASSTSTQYVNTISFDTDGNAVISSGGAYLRYNSASNNERFRYYKSSSYTGQKPIALYKKSASSASVAAPVISPETGTYETRPQTVSITCSTAGATIYYTTDGTTPTTSSTVYTAPFDVRKNTTVMAIAAMTVDGNTVVSRVASSVITMKVNAPEFSPADGSSFSEAYNVSISADEGLTIYYITQDNKIFKSDTGKTASYSESTGELVSTALVYSIPLTFHQSMMVTAICMDADGNLSDPVTVQYTFSGSVVPPYYSSFSASAGDFVATQTEDDNTLTGNGAPEWKMNSNTGASAIANWGEERYYMYVRGTSGNTNQTRTRWYGTADFTSPMINLTDKDKATFSFIHAGHHFYNDPNTSSSGTRNDCETTLSASTAGSPVRTSCHVYIDDYGTDGASLVDSKDVSDDVNWFEQAFRDDIANSSNPKTLASSSTTSRSGSFPRANSGDISLEDYEDHYIKIRFSYTSTPQSYGTWNIDQITVNAVDVEEMNMNAKGWTTYVFDQDIDAYATTQNYTTNGKTLEIYKVTEFDFDEVVLQQLGKFAEYTTENNSERYIPAKTPVVIHGPASETIRFVKYSSPSMLPTVKKNMLIASLSPNTAVAPVGSGIRYFVLQMKEGATEPYFNKVKEGREIPDHKAYLNGADEIEQVSVGGNIKERGIYVLGGDGEDEATGINEVDNPKETLKNGVIYNLAGQRVVYPTKGLYIVNGKKVYLK